MGEEVSGDSSDGTLIMHDLPSGIIRLAGRYWEAGKYKVKLKVNHGGKTGELEITVVKPDRLGDQYGKGPRRIRPDGGRGLADHRQRRKVRHPAAVYQSAHIGGSRQEKLRRGCGMGICAFVSV